jgi:hypothetical protein
MVARILLILALLLPVPAVAQDVASLEGSWALEIGGATIFRFDLEPIADKDEWRGTWSRPSRFASDGDNFNSVRLPAEQIRSMAGLVFDGQVEVSFPDPRPNAIPDIFRFRLIDPDAVEMTYVGTTLAPYVLQRVSRQTPLGPFEQGATYSRLEVEAPQVESPAERGPPPVPTIEPEEVLAVPEDPDDPSSFRLPPAGIQGR